MIKLGCASTHQEDFDFLHSPPVAELLKRKDCSIEPASVPLEESSADVLLASTDMVNKLASETDLDSLTWVMISGNPKDALRAWQLGAAYFLLRPLDTSAFARAVERARQLRLGKISLSIQHRPKIEFQLTKGRRLSVSTQDILFLEARGEVTQVHLSLHGQEKLVATRNLGFWEQQLGGAEFVRVHKKYLVNVAHISTLHPDAVTVRAHTLPVAKRRKKEVDQACANRGVFPRSVADTAAAVDPLPFVNKN